MARRISSFTPEDLLGTPLSPISEQRSNPPSVANGDITVLAVQFNSRPYQRRSHPSPVITRDFASQATQIGPEPEGAGDLQEPFDESTTEQQRTHGDSATEASTALTHKYTEGFESLNRTDSNLSNWSNTSVAGSTASSFRRRLIEIRRPYPSATGPPRAPKSPLMVTENSKVQEKYKPARVPTDPAAAQPARHRTLFEVLDQTKDRTAQQWRDKLEAVEQHLRRKKKDSE
jgi:hypothetical protein